VDSLLDTAELALARWALAEGKPVLGICRGQQCLNVAAGGTLFQDIPSEVVGALDHRVEPRDARAHELAVEPDSRLADLLGATRTAVNSLHHQAVREVAPGFVAVAWAPDGVIEGLERPDHPFAVSVQFHPEELVPGHEPSERLVQRFVAEAASRSLRNPAVRPLG
jgi:putative glutamine amidotransferase